MKLSGRAMRLSIFIGERDTRHHRSLYAEIVRRAHKAGLAGATVLPCRGVLSLINLGNTCLVQHREELRDLPYTGMGCRRGEDQSLSGT